MRFIRFLISSLALSIPVFFRILPIFLVVVFLVSALYYALLDYLLVFKVVIIATGMPLISFIAVNAVRAALVQKGISRGPDINRMMKMVFIWAGIFTIFTLGFVITSIAAIQFTADPEVASELPVVEIEEPAPNAIRTGPYLPGGILVEQTVEEELKRGLGTQALETLTGLETNQIRAIFVVQMVFSLLVSGMLIPFTARAAHVGVMGPGHDFFWGAGRRMPSIFAVMALAGLFQYAVIGQILAAFLDAAVLTIQNIATGDLLLVPVAGALGLGGAIMVFLYGYCIVAAASALAYVDVRGDIEAERKNLLQGILDSAEPAPDIRAILRERQEKTKLARPAAAALLPEETEIPEALDGEPVVDPELVPSSRPLANDGPAGVYNPYAHLGTPADDDDFPESDYDFDEPEPEPEPEALPAAKQPVTEEPVPMSVRLGGRASHPEPEPDEDDGDLDWLQKYFDDDAGKPQDGKKAEPDKH